MGAPIYTFEAGVPTDPRVLAVYNGLNRAQRARYDIIPNDQRRSDYLHGVAEEKKKPVCLLSIRWCTFAIKFLLRLVINVSGGVA